MQVNQEVNKITLKDGIFSKTPQGFSLCQISHDCDSNRKILAIFQKVWQKQPKPFFTAVITEHTLLLVPLSIQEDYFWQGTWDTLFSLCSQQNQWCYDNFHWLRTVFKTSECKPSGYVMLPSPTLCFPVHIITAELLLSPRQLCKEHKW